MSRRVCVCLAAAGADLWRGGGDDRRGCVIGYVCLCVAAAVAGDWIIGSRAKLSWGGSLCGCRPSSRAWHARGRGLDERRSRSDDARVLILCLWLCLGKLACGTCVRREKGSVFTTLTSFVYTRTAKHIRFCQTDIDQDRRVRVRQAL